MPILEIFRFGRKPPEISPFNYIPKIRPFPLFHLLLASPLKFLLRSLRPIFPKSNPKLIAGGVFYAEFSDKCKVVLVSVCYVVSMRRSSWCFAGLVGARDLDEASLGNLDQ
ncbi:hypothetical protein Droror1_Dr00000333, partial [Drosera rotundifolia]